MATFVQLTRASGKVVLVNLDRIETVGEADGADSEETSADVRSVLNGSGWLIRVRESIQAIKALAWEVHDDAQLEPVVGEDPRD